MWPWPRHIQSPCPTVSPGSGSAGADTRSATDPPAVPVSEAALDLLALFM